MKLLTAILLSALAVVAHADVPPAPRIGLLGWPSDPADPMRALSSELEDCLAQNVHETAPEINIVPQRAIRDALFPLMESSTQPPTEGEFAGLLAREDVRQRLAKRGLDYLVTFSDVAHNEPWQGVILGGGISAYMGFMWRDETTTLTVGLWSLDGVRLSARETVDAKGTSLVPAVGLPIPLMAQTRGQACAEISQRIVTIIKRGNYPEGARK